MARVKMAVIGCGFISTSVHLPSLTEIPDVEVVAVCDVVEEKARKTAEQFKVEKYYTDYHKVLEMPEVDAVLIATPPLTHKDQVINAARAGKHVFVEKPITTNVKDAKEVVDAIKKAGVKCMVGFCLRFHSMFKHVKELIDSGRLGRPVNIWRVCVWPLPPAPWLKDKTISGGMLVENAVHAFDAFRWFAGDVDTVYAKVMTVQSGITIEDNASVVCIHKEGTISTLIQSWSGTHSWDSWGVVGEKGTVAVEGYLSGVMKIRIADGPYEQLRMEEDWKLMYKRELEYFIKCIIEDKRPEINEVEGLRALEIAEAALRSSAEGRPIKLPLE
ncbi:MAG: hypothetical protein DRN15_02060 [Thermoprotei archaeon]|nr:MAG: hypothetical protein DRN15_02060 [Thermoprotei archaeon]